MVYLGMKRGREGEVNTLFSLPDCLMFLSHTPGFDSNKSDSPSRVFECKTCNRQFSSFQALGGHRASHKKQRLAQELTTRCSQPKPKSHECAVCGLVFTVGQALGGHMRRHRVVVSDENESTELTLCPKEKSEEFLCLDLNLTPSENDSGFQFNKVAPKIICFL